MKKNLLYYLVPLTFHATHDQIFRPLHIFLREPSASASQFLAEIQFFLREAQLIQECFIGPC